MKRTNTVLTVTAGAMALAALTLSACGGGEKKADAPKADAPKAETPKAEAPAATLVDLDITHEGAKLKGDPAAGKRVFGQCQTCHQLAEGRNGVGPSLYKIVGRTAGQVPNFKYSDANKKSGKVWNQQTLFEYLEDPRRAIPNTIMQFNGLKKVEDRANLIAFLSEEGAKTGDAKK